MHNQPPLHMVIHNNEQRDNQNQESQQDEDDDLKTRRSDIGLFLEESSEIIMWRVLRSLWLDFGVSCKRETKLDNAGSPIQNREILYRA